MKIQLMNRYLKVAFYEGKPPEFYLFIILLFYSIFTWCYTHLLFEGSVKGPHGVKAYEVTYFRYGFIGFFEILAGV